MNEIKRNFWRRDDCFGVGLTQKMTQKIFFEWVREFKTYQHCHPSYKLM